MTTRSSAPSGAARCDARVCTQSFGATGRRVAHLFIACGLVVGLQGVTAGPAAVATLPYRLAVLAPIEVSPIEVAPIEVKEVFDPSLTKKPGLFASILKAAFPFLSKTEATDTASPRSPVAEDMEELVSFGKQSAPRWLVQSILNAARIAGVDPVYMMTLADVESSLSPDAKAATSSAEGLFQFIDRTWLETLYTHAADYGYGAVAEAIKMVDGEPALKNEKDKAWVMSLRRDPYFSALMAGELIKDIERELQGQGERELAEAELYLAHFLGATSAIRFLHALDESPDVAASKLFPQAAKANAGLFTEVQGRKRRPISVAGLYDRIDSKIVRRLDRYEAVEPRLLDTANLAKQSVEANAAIR